jgi:hypothetical protein
LAPLADGPCDVEVVELVEPARAIRTKKSKEIQAEAQGKVPP